MKNTSKQQTILSSLEKIQEEYPDSPKLSLSVGVNNQDIDQARIRIKTELEKFLPELESDGSQQIEIRKQVMKKFNELDNDVKGFVVYLCFPKDSECITRTYPLPVETEQVTSVATVFNPLPILFTEVQTPGVLVLDLHYEQVKLYWVNDDMKLLHTIENKFLPEESPEFLETYTPENTKSMIHGGGNDKHQRRHDKVREEFVNDITPILEKEIRNQKPTFMFIFSPHSFSSIVERWKGELQKNFQLPTKVVLETIESEQQLRANVFTLTDQMIQSESQELIQQATDQSLGVSSWQTISDQASRGQLDKVWMSPDVTRSGFVYENNTALTYKVGDVAEPVDDIVPYLVWNLHQQGSKIYPIGELDTPGDTDIFAIRRY